MNAKAYDKKTAAFAGYVIQNIPADLTDEIMDNWMNNPAAMKKFLAGLAPSKTGASPKRKPLLSVVATNALGAMEGKKTVECFIERSCNNDIDILLSMEQPNTVACVVSVCNVNGRTDQNQMLLEVICALPGVEQTNSVIRLSHSLIACGYTLTLPQVENLAERTRLGENTGLRTDYWGNMFLIKDLNNLVSIGCVNSRDGRRLRACQITQLKDCSLVSLKTRFLVRNLDASKL